MSSQAIKLSPLHVVAKKSEARFTEAQGWSVVEEYGAPEAALRAARTKVAIVDATLNGKLIVEGGEAEALLGAVLDISDLAINTGTIVSGVGVYRLRTDHYFVGTEPGEEDEIQRRLMEGMAQQGGLITVTDFTHGRSEFQLIGPDSQGLLGKMCGLDFHCSAFVDGAAKQSSVAKTNQLIIRSDIGTIPKFIIIGTRSLGQYLWETILEAGREYDLIPMGQSVLRTLLEAEKP